MTEEIKHINEKNQEYIAEGNRMTEKIIIDGVDVAGCNDFYKEWDNRSGKDNYRCQDFLSGMCAGNNCYYKQLKRLEQERDELKKANQFLSILGTDLASAHETVRKEFFRADKNKDMWREKAEEYRSALEEIREIAKDIIENNVYENSDIKAEKILTKINEVIQ